MTAPSAPHKAQRPTPARQPDRAVPVSDQDISIIGRRVQELASRLEHALLKNDAQGLADAWFRIRGLGMDLDRGDVRAACCTPEERDLLYRS